MRDRSGLACLNAGKGRHVRGGLAETALIFQLLLLVGSHHGNRFIPHGIIGIFINYLKDIRRACGDAITATIAFVRINGNEKITGGILMSVIG